MRLRLNVNDSDPRPSAGGFVQIRAFSKINLILEVLGKRDDGYHELRSVMQSLALHDTITIKTSKLTVSGQEQQKPPTCYDNFQLACSDPSLPTDNRNLVTRAAKYMMQEYGITQPVSIQLEKRIPVAAGLAGGSSDCAATLLGLNRLFGLNIPLHSTTQTSLMEIGRRFGADVPFCLMMDAVSDKLTTPGVTALAEGIGEILTPLAPHPPVWIVLACPDIHVSTANIFGRCETDIFNQPSKIGRTTAAPHTNSNCHVMLEALAAGDLQAIAANFKNDLTQITIKLHPEIQNIISEMTNQGALGAAMSGSGPSVFGYFGNKEEAQKAQEKMLSITGRAFLTHI